MDFPRLQLASLTLVLLFAQLWNFDFSQPTNVLIAFTTISLLTYQVWWIAPYSRYYPAEVPWAEKKDPDNTIRILAANVLTSNRNAPALIRLISNYRPDIVLTLESDAWWEEQLTEIEKQLPHCVKVPLDNLYGMHLYSRYALSETEVKYLVEDDVPSIHTIIQLPSGVDIRAHFVHPAPPSPTENETSQERDAELILVAKSIENSSQPIIVAGDLNDVAWSATTRLFRRISGLRDPRIGRGLLNTFHAAFWFIRWPLDHIFHSDNFKVSEIERLPAFGSDHFAIFTELVYDPTQTTGENGLESRKKDKDWASTKLAATEASPADVPTPGSDSTGT